MRVTDERLLRIRAATVQAQPWLRFLVSRHRYRLLDEEQLRARRRSDTVYIFGSGASLNDISAAQWEAIALHDTFGFNWFVHQRFVRCDFHLIRGIPDTDFDRGVWKPQLTEYFGLIRSNPRFADTVFCVQTGFRATNGNRALGLRLLSEGSSVFLWRTRTRRREPGRSFAEGLTHAHSTLSEVVNLAFLAGWRRIVLVGVDLYDRNYFWMPPGETRSVDTRRSADAADPHVQAATGLIEHLAAWNRTFDREGVRIEVLNSRSLLAGALPIHVLGQGPGASVGYGGNVTGPGSQSRMTT
jgi:hypothetical protein